MALIALYLLFLLIFGIGTSVVTYHILKYRDQGDISGVVLAIYFILATIIIVGTAILVDWPTLFSSTIGLF